MNCYIKSALLCLWLSFMVFPGLLAQTYAPLPFFESFDQVWINGTDVRDIPGNSWKNTPASGANSWSRYDDGYNRGAWSSPFPYLLIEEGADSSEFSARIHTSNTDQPGMLDLYVDFSTVIGSKILSFWYLNYYKKDSLLIMLSENGGSSFGPPLAIIGKTGYAWTPVFVDLGISTSSTVVVRFQANTNYSQDDICIDQVKLNGMAAAFKSDTLSGMAPLSVNFTDLSLGSPFSWNWDFDNDGQVDATSQNPSHTYSTPGSYTVKLEVARNGSSDLLIKKQYIHVYDYAAVPFYEAFEKDWITCKNVHEVPSMSWKCDDTYWGRSDDAIIKKWSVPQFGGNSSFPAPYNYTARYHSMGSAWIGNLDLLVNLSSPDMSQLSFYYNNFDGEDSLKIYLSVDGGDSFSDTLKTLGISRDWKKITLDLGTSLSPTSVIRFSAKGAAQKSGCSDIFIDEVKVGEINTDIRNLESETGIFKAFPNPSGDLIDILLTIPDQHMIMPMEIIDLNGRVVRSFYFDSATPKSINIQDLTNGMYYIRAIGKDKVYLCKIIKI